MVFIDVLSALLQDILTGVLGAAGPGAVEHVAEGAVPPLANSLLGPVDNNSIRHEAYVALSNRRGADPAVEVDVWELLFRDAK